MTTDFLINFGIHVRSLRQAKRLTQFQLAEMAGLSESHIRRIEAGSRSIGLYALTRLADALNISLWNPEILSDDGIRESNDMEVLDLLHNCDAKEKRIMMETIRVLYKTLKTC